MRIGRHVGHALSTWPTLIPRARLSCARRSQMCRTRAAQALNGGVWPTRAPMKEDTISTRTSSLQCRDPVAVRTRASPTHDHRPTYPHSPCGLLESRRCAGTWCMWSTSSFFMSEHSEPFYYRPVPRPQASAPPSSRCAARFSSPPTCSLRPRRLLASWSAARTAVAAGGAAEAGLRRFRRPRSRARP